MAKNKEEQKKEKPVGPYVRMDTKFKEVFVRLVGILMRRKGLLKSEADYVLEPLGEEAGMSGIGITFFNEKGKRIS